MCFKLRLSEYFNLLLFYYFSTRCLYQFFIPEHNNFYRCPREWFWQLSCYCCLFLTVFYINSQCEQNLGVWKSACPHDQPQGYHICLHLPVFPPILPSRVSWAYLTPACVLIGLGPASLPMPCFTYLNLYNEY